MNYINVNFYKLLNFVSEKRTFLTQALEGRLILLYHANGDYAQALGTVNRVMKELKKMDDKQLLMEVQLSESKVRFTAIIDPQSDI